VNGLGLGVVIKRELILPFLIAARVRACARVRPCCPLQPSRTRCRNVLTNSGRPQLKVICRKPLPTMKMYGRLFVTAEDKTSAVSRREIKSFCGTAIRNTRGIHARCPRVHACIPPSLPPPSHVASRYREGHLGTPQYRLFLDKHAIIENVEGL
jgi:hypothetical protein